MKCLLCSILASLLLVQSHAQTILFQQDFSAGNTTSSYVDTGNPGTTKFTEIGVTAGSNAAPTASIVNGAAELSRLNADNGGGQCRLVRSTDLSTTAQCLYVQFTMDVGVGNAALWSYGDNGAFFSIGDGSTFGNNGTVPRNDETFGKLFFSIGGSAQNVTWTVAKRVNSTSTNAATFFQGQHRVTWVLNTSGYRFTYLTPAGSTTTTVSSGKWDVWVDNTQLFDEVPATMTGINLRKFKFIFDGNIGTIRLDNFLIRDVSGSLPVTLTSFSGKAQGPQIDLTWTTAAEHNSDLFTVERSADGQEFQAIGSVRAVGDSDGPHTYSFPDLSPTTGTNYYRLRQTDRDGATTFSKLTAIAYEPGGAALVLLNNPATPDGIRVRTHALASPVYRLCTLTGQPIELATFPQSDDAVWLKPVGKTLPAGIYLLTAQTGSTRLTRQILIR